MDEKGLVGTWFPVMDEHYNDTVPLFSPMLYIFETKRKGRTEVLGNNSKLYPFGYLETHGSIRLK